MVIKKMTSHYGRSTLKKEKNILIFMFCALFDRLASTCRYVRLNVLTILHIHGPCFNTPQNCTVQKVAHTGYVLTEDKLRITCYVTGNKI